MKLYRKDCENVYRDGSAKLHNCKEHVQDTLMSFDDFITRMEEMKQELIDEKRNAASILESIANGAYNGMRVGHRLLPIIGAVPGAFVGAVEGAISGLVEQNEQLRRELQEQLDILYNIIYYNHV